MFMLNVTADRNIADFARKKNPEDNPINETFFENN